MAAVVYSLIAIPVFTKKMVEHVAFKTEAKVFAYAFLSRREDLFVQITRAMVEKRVQFMRAVTAWLPSVTEGERHIVCSDLASFTTDHPECNIKEQGLELKEMIIDGSRRLGVIHDTPATDTGFPVPLAGAAGCLPNSSL